MKTQQTTTTTSVDVRVRPLGETDLSEAERIFHLAFGTYLGLPDPMQFFPDRNYAGPRYHINPESALGAEADGELIGSSFLANWGAVAVFGPIMIRPDFWDRGVARCLLEATTDMFPRWGTKHAGLFTFADSAKHLHLYQKFGFWPRFLTAIMSRPIRSLEPAATFAAYSELNPNQQSEGLKSCRELTHTIYEGLDLQREIRAVANQKLGDTVLLWDHSRLIAFAVCHCGAGTEAGNDTCYVKFGAAQSAEAFEGLLDACQSFARKRGLTRIEAGVNLARHEVYQRLLARGFRTDIQGVAMHRPNEPGYCRPDVFVMDDWR